MSTPDIKKDHSIGAGTGATAGAVSGALIGAAAGPVGAALGAIVGGVGGAKAGDTIAEYVNPTEYDAHWQDQYRSADYYNRDRDWDDYAPAYGLGYYAREKHRGEKFDDLDGQLETTWDKTKGNSRLSWNEARDAVRDGWHYVEHRLPGDFDNDGR
jgi:hypothetical protein